MERCAICLEDMDKDKNRVTFNCGHTIHFTCFCKMILIEEEVKKSKCPLCRDILVKKSLLDEIRPLIIPDLTRRISFDFGETMITTEEDGSILRSLRRFWDDNPDATQRNVIDVIMENVANEMINDIVIDLGTQSE